MSSESGDGGGDGDFDFEIDSRRSRHTTKFDRIRDGEPRLFGKRPSLTKQGREIANGVSCSIMAREPEFVEDAGDPSLGEVLQYMMRVEGDGGLHYEGTDTLCGLLSRGLTFREAVTFYLYEYGGLTLREIYHVDAGKERSYSKKKDRRAEKKVAATLQEAARKLDINLKLSFDS